MQGSQAYLLISPTSNNPVNDSYNGCFVMRFTDLARGTLAREANGKLAAVKKISGRPGTFNGACTYRPSVAGSAFLYGEINFTNKPFFQILQIPITGELRR